MYQAERWFKDERFFAPMYIHKTSGEHIYIGDVVSLVGGTETLGKVVKFYTMSTVSITASSKNTLSF